MVVLTYFLIIIGKFNVQLTFIFNRCEVALDQFNALCVYAARACHR